MLLEAQGLAVLRRQRGEVYVALDYGEHGGGHGHPDRLNVIFADGTRRWLDDPGTGSYVDPSLHWYRATLAHAAPLVDGRSQRPASGELLAWDERDGVGWVDAMVEDVAAGVALRRTLVVLPDYFVDVLAWDAGHEARIELPFPVAATLDAHIAWVPDELESDGAAYLRDVQRASAPLDAVEFVTPELPHPVAFVRSAAVEWWRATAPGAPGHAEQPLHVARCRGATGELVTVWSARGQVLAVELEDDALRITLADGTSQLHRRDDERWHIRLFAGGGHSTIELGGARAPEMTHQELPFSPAPPEEPWMLHDAFVADLGEEHYRQSELSWHQVGEPRATVEITADGRALAITVEVGEARAAAVRARRRERDGQ